MGTILEYYWLLLLFVANVQCQKYCYTKDKNPYLYFGTKTSYFAVAPDKDAAKKPIEFPGCSARSMWLLVRHGSRNPSDDEILEAEKVGTKIRDLVIKSHRDGKGNLCKEDLKLISDWKPSWKVDEEKLLVDSGRKELREMGERYRERMKDIFKPQDKAGAVYTVRHTAKERTESSALEFISGAFPDKEDKKGIMFLRAIEDDPLLRFYSHCTKWQDEVDDNDDVTLAAQREFEKRPAMVSALWGVMARLGLNQTMPDVKKKREKARDDSSDGLSMKDMMILYNICRFETARIPKKPSPWCAAFRQDTALLEVLEYHQDLAVWSSDGYGNELNAKIACPLVRDMIKTFSEDMSTQHRGTFYFSHSSSILTLLTLLGLYNDDTNLNWHNFDVSKVRKYRSSQIGAFASNVGFVLYDCEEEPTERILVLHQEQPVQIPACKDILCSWKEFNCHFSEAIACPFHKICGNRLPKKEPTTHYCHSGTRKNNLSTLLMIIFAVTKSIVIR